MANSVGPDAMGHSGMSYLGLHCLLRPVCPNTYINTVDTVQLIRVNFLSLTPWEIPADDSLIISYFSQKMGFDIYNVVQIVILEDSLYEM